MISRLLFYMCLIGCLMIKDAAQAQVDTVRLNMYEAIDLARGDSPLALLAETRYVGSYWDYRLFKSSLLPQLSFNGQLPVVNRGIDAITQNDGTDVFINRSQMRNNAGLSFTQNIGLTGGSVSATTGLQRIDIFSPRESTSYLSDVISFRVNQPLFRFNELKWNKILQPWYLKEAEQLYSENFADLDRSTVQLFFDCHLGQLELDAAKSEKLAADSLFVLTQGRYEVGRVSETELLQIELRAKTAEARIATAVVALQGSTEQLRNHLGIETEVYFRLTPPEDLLDIDIDVHTAVSQALKNKREATAFDRRVQERQRNLDQATKEAGLNLDLNASFGLSNTAETVPDAYDHLIDQQMISLGVFVPILDWGQNKARKEVARYELELEMRNVSLDRVNFERQITLRVQQFELVKNRVLLAERALEVAKRTLDLSDKRYRIGKIDVVDLILANNAFENSRTAYVNALATYWNSYYELMFMCMYDFEHQTPIQLDLPTAGQ